jgi:hypothetical protein
VNESPVAWDSLINVVYPPCVVFVTHPKQEQDAVLGAWDLGAEPGQRAVPENNIFLQQNHCCLPVRFD